MKRQRIPKLFRKPITEHKLRKNLLSRIHIQSESTFLSSKLKQNADGSYTLVGELSKDEIQRLAAIAKAVKKNRGILVAWKAAIVVVLIVLLIGFNALFKNRLIENAAESALQKVFRAAVDISGTNVSLMKGSAEFDRLTVADEEQPMRNLFELGRTNLSIDIGAALSGRVILNEVACREIQFHTPRKVSGALPEYGPTEDSTREKEKTEAMVDEVKTLGLEIGRESARNLIRQYEASLRSPALIQSARERFEETRERWDRRLEETDRQIETVDSQTRAVLDTDISSLDTAAEIKAYLEKLDRLQTTIEDTARTVDESYAVYQADMEYIDESRTSIDSAVVDDLGFLKEAVGNLGSDATGMISATAQPILRERFGRIYTYSEKAVRIYDRLSSESGKKQSRFSDRGRKGTIVSFPRIASPAFMLENLEISAGNADSSGFTEFRAQNITGNQDILGKATTARFETAPSLGSTGSRLGSDIQIDGRQGSDYLMESDTALQDIPVSIDGGMDAISVKSLRADSDGTFRLQIRPDLSGRGSAEINLSNLEIGYSDTSTVTAGALAEILDGLDTVQIEAEFGYTEGTLTELRIRSDVDDLLNERIGEYLDAQAEKAAAEIEAAFYDSIAEELDANETLNREISEQGNEFIDDLRTTRSLESAVENRREELTARAEDEIGQKTDELKDKAAGELEELGKELKIPGF